MPNGGQRGLGDKYWKTEPTRYFIVGIQYFWYCKYRRRYRYFKIPNIGSVFRYTDPRLEQTCHLWLPGLRNWGLLKRERASHACLIAMHIANVRTTAIMRNHPRKALFKIKTPLRSAESTAVNIAPHDWSRRPLPQKWFLQMRHSNSIQNNFSLSKSNIFLYRTYLYRNWHLCTEVDWIDILYVPKVIVPILTFNVSKLDVPKKTYWKSMYRNCPVPKVTYPLYLGNLSSGYPIG